MELFRSRKRKPNLTLRETIAYYLDHTELREEKAWDQIEQAETIIARAEVTIIQAKEARDTLQNIDVELQQIGY